MQVFKRKKNLYFSVFKFYKVELHGQLILACKISLLFGFFFIKTYVVGTQWKHLLEMLPKYFCGELKKYHKV